MIWILIIAGVYVILVFPFFLETQFLYKQKNEKVFFKISIDKIPVLNGYVGITDKKIAIHYAKNKAKIITAKDVVSVRSSIKPLIDLNILKIDNVLDVPKENVPLIIGSVFAYNQASAILKFKKPYLKNKLNVNQSDYILFYNKSISVFNILSLCLFIIKNIIGKIYESTKRK